MTFTSPPNVPDGCSVLHRVGMAEDPFVFNGYWFLFESDADIEGWFKEIAKTLKLHDVKSFKEDALEPFKGVLRFEPKYCKDSLVKDATASTPYVSFATVKLGEIVVDFGLGRNFVLIKKCRVSDSPQGRSSAIYISMKNLSHGFRE